jgi:hypothetical protein
MRARWLNVAIGVVAVGFTTLPAHAGGVPKLEVLIVTDGPKADGERQAIAAALRTLPRVPWRVAVIDANEAMPDVRRTLLRLDTFITRGGRVVYVVRQSALLQGAREGSLFHVHALAAAIWHELAHIDGADERAARTHEQEIWTSFVRDQQVDGMTGLRYLSALTKRPDDQLLALR